MARVVFLGTPEFAVPVLERLFAAHEVAAVITQPDQPAGRGRQYTAVPPVKVWAEAHQLPVFQPARIRRDKELLAHLEALQPDVLVLAAYGQILRENVLNLAPAGCIGVHASLLPRLRGAAPIAAAILNGDQVTGVTLMHTDAGMDTGPIIAQREVPVAPGDTLLTLTGKLANAGADLLIEILPAWLAGAITARAQDESLATLAPPLNHEQGRLDWRRAATDLERRVRALNPWPGTWTVLDGLLVKVLAARVAADALADGDPGTVVKAGDEIAVITGSGLLVLDYIQPAGKRAMAAADYARGRRGFIGSRLG